MKRNIAVILAASLILVFALAGCGNAGQGQGDGQAETAVKNDDTSDVRGEEQTKDGDSGDLAPNDRVQAYHDALAELEKAKEGQKVDFAKVQGIYLEKLQPLVQQRDSERKETTDELITSALNAGTEGQLDAPVVYELFDKLMQKAFYRSVNAELLEIGDHFDDKEKANKELEEAKTYYEALKETVEKRDAAYGTTMADTINGAFESVQTAINDGGQLDYSLARQVIDKTMMRTFYLAVGGEKGYAFKLAQIAKQDPDKVKAEQAEAWAFFQSVYGYMAGSDKDAADYVLTQFDLQTDIKDINPENINKACIKGFLNVAKSEYSEIEENFGKDKAAIVTMEGALFIQLVELDLIRLMGDEDYAGLKENAQALLDAVKSGDKNKTTELLKDVNGVLDQVIAQVSAA